MLGAVSERCRTRAATGPTATRSDTARHGDGPRRRDGRSGHAPALPSGGRRGRAVLRAHGAPGCPLA
ncbi:MAG: hypothetical protein AVDCRST_MAG49-4525 [uncultured Thermomicrobiales bacterium]|uniref:Uncharacterized protein n=1 Tax=uncultured Thermomicrobiales bacterium TaxID=1645740 RepID=A0A6J4VIS9_9BACT|nr:MAG: hypothetical protein AVDCRST_MAG49-4525 [uncultured Thermomicrobiales bacterium]